MTASKLQNGVYNAHLAGCEVRLSGNGKPMLAFLWRIDNNGVTIKSFVHLCLKDGSPNVKGIGLVKSWAPGWNGTDLYWFSEHLPLASTYPVKLTVSVEPSYRDPSQMIPVVKWVNAANGRWGKSLETQNDAENHSAPVTPNREELKKHLEAVQPTMQDVWRAFKILFGHATQPQIERKWFELLDACREGGRDVDQFTLADWQRVIDRLAAI